MRGDSASGDPMDPALPQCLPTAFKAGVNTLLMACKGNSIVSTLPQELWFRIFGFLDRDWLSRPDRANYADSVRRARPQRIVAGARSCGTAARSASANTGRAQEDMPALLPDRGQESGHMSVLNTPRLQHTSPPQHTAYGTPTVSPMLQPTAAMMFSRVSTWKTNLSLTTRGGDILGVGRPLFLGGGRGV